jgi:hypothetical protein
LDQAGAVLDELKSKVVKLAEDLMAMTNRESEPN